ncbi:MAG: alpha/beta fold hydrolase [Pseudomonadales bacterium]|nr:alpha/beta fold hydrolase [Pseudomonadales bacterium]MCP5183754.1 alpha/beta fold hydrolase [Pseudomonadales bacterium]
MPVLDRNGVAIHYETYGTGPAILLTHGYSASTAMWQPNIEALSAHHTLILWDIRGHGRSAAPDDPALYSREASVADMAALLDHLGVDTAIIGGLSLGGYLSLAFNVAHPERVRALLIFDTGPGYRNPVAREQWNRTAIQSGETHGSTGLRLAARGILTQKDAAVLDSLSGISVPTLVLAGENDTPFLKATQVMGAKIPHARTCLIADAGHTANSDQPDAFNAAVCDFLAGC